MFPASPLDWDSLTDPEYLFTAVPPDSPPPGQCRSLIHGVLGGRPVSWEVTVDLGHLWTPESQDIEVSGVYGRGGEEGRGGKSWQEIIHQLTARSVIRDFEKMAEKESDIGHGGRFTGCFFSLINVPLSPNYCASLTIPLFDGFLGSAKRYRTKAIQTSKHCNIICMYTAFTTTDSNPNKGLADMDVQTTGVPPTNTNTQIIQEVLFTCQ